MKFAIPLHKDDYELKHFIDIYFAFDIITWNTFELWCQRKINCQRSWWSCAIVFVLWVSFEMFMPSQKKIYVDLIGSNQNVTQSNYSLTIYNKTQLQQKSINGITIHNLDTKHQCLRIWVLSFFMCLITLSLPLLPPIHTVKTRLLFYVENINGKNCIFVCCSIKRLRFCVWVFAELLQAHFPSSTQEVICGT